MTEIMIGNCLEMHKSKEVKEFVFLDNHNYRCARARAHTYFFLLLNFKFDLKLLNISESRGELYPASLHLRSPFDPDNLRIQGVYPQGEQASADLEQARADLEKLKARLR